MDNFSDRLTLERAGGQTGDTRSTFRPPLWGATVHTSYWKVGGIKIESAPGRQKKSRADTQIREKMIFFLFGLQSECGQNVVRV